MTWLLVQIGAGGALGAVCRYLTVLGTARLLGAGFPYGTLMVNVVGCFAMGALFVVVAGSGGVLSRAGPLVLTGFLGGYTTFSAFSLDFWQLLNSGRAGAAVLYAAGSACASIAALLIGIMLARQVLS